MLNLTENDLAFILADETTRIVKRSGYVASVETKREDDPPRHFYSFSLHGLMPLPGADRIPFWEEISRSIVFNAPGVPVEANSISSFLEKLIGKSVNELFIVTEDVARAASCLPDNRVCSACIPVMGGVERCPRHQANPLAGRMAFPVEPVHHECIPGCMAYTPTPGVMKICERNGELVGYRGLQKATS